MPTFIKQDGVSQALLKKIDQARRRVVYLERLAEAKADVAAGRVSEPIKSAKDLLK